MTSKQKNKSTIRLLKFIIIQFIMMIVGIYNLLSITRGEKFWMWITKLNRIESRFKVDDDDDDYIMCRKLLF